MNSYTIDTSLRHTDTHTWTHTHTHTHTGNGCFGFCEDHSILKVLVVLDVSKAPPCLPLRWCNFLAESMLLIYLRAWVGGFVSMGSEFGWSRFSLTGSCKNVDHPACTMVSKPWERHRQTSLQRCSKKERKKSHYCISCVFFSASH